MSSARPARSQPSNTGSSPAILEMSPPAKSVTPSVVIRMICGSLMPARSIGLNSTVILPPDASGMVSVQNGTSSPNEMMVLLFRPIALTFISGRSAAAAAFASGKHDVPRAPDLSTTNGGQSRRSSPRRHPAAIVVRTTLTVGRRRQPRGVAADSCGAYPAAGGCRRLAGAAVDPQHLARDESPERPSKQLDQPGDLVDRGDALERAALR